MTISVASSNASATPIAGIAMPAMPTMPSDGAAPPEPLDAAALFDAATAPQASTAGTGAGPSLDALLRANRTYTPPQVASSVLDMPASQIAKVVIQNRGAAQGLPQDYIDTALRAQDVAAGIEADINNLAAQAEQQLSSPAGSTDGIFTLLQQMDQRSTQLLRFEELLHENFRFAAHDPKRAKSQLEEWLRSVGAG
jgi:hypothetical protein